MSSATRSFSLIHVITELKQEPTKKKSESLINKVTFLRRRWPTTSSFRPAGTIDGPIGELSTYLRDIWVDRRIGLVDTSGGDVRGAVLWFYEKFCQSEARAQSLSGDGRLTSLSTSYAGSFLQITQCNGSVPAYQTIVVAVTKTNSARAGIAFSRAGLIPLAFSSRKASTTAMYRVDLLHLGT